MAANGETAFSSGNGPTTPLHLLLSIKPHFAAAIYAGHKTAEYRRSAPRRGLPGWALIYETHPVSAVTGMMRAGAPQCLRNGELNQMEPDIAAYLAGARAPCALPIFGATLFARPVSLGELLPDGGRRPPQSWRYVTLLTLSTIDLVVPAQHALKADQRRL